MKCLETIDCGSSLARAELIFLTTLLVELGDSIDPRADLPCSLGFSDVYRTPALGADNFIQLEKPSIGLLEHLAALQARAFKNVRVGIEIAGHDFTCARQ
jgi:hypothetical protein